MNTFTTPQFQQSLQRNQQLVKQADETKKQAESGQLFKQVAIQETDAPIGRIPTGGTALTDMERNNPQQYNELQTNYGQLFSLKQLMDQINQNL